MWEVKRKRKKVEDQVEDEVEDEKWKMMKMMNYDLKSEEINEPWRKQPGQRDRP